MVCVNLTPNAWQKYINCFCSLAIVVLPCEGLYLSDGLTIRVIKIVSKISAFWTKDRLNYFIGGSCCTSKTAHCCVSHYITYIWLFWWVFFSLQQLMLLFTAWYKHKSVITDFAFLLNLVDCFCISTYIQTKILIFKYIIKDVHSGIWTGAIIKQPIKLT